jgi:hypothetical protein
MRLAASERAAAALAMALATALGATLVSPRASAYCRTSACGEVSSQVCAPSRPGDCGLPLYWPKHCMGYSIQEGGSGQLSLATIESLAATAFGAWTRASCGGGAPGIGVAYLGPVSCDRPEYNEKAGNANVIMVRDDEWPYTGQGQTLALTTVTFNLDTGEIYDADLEVNGTSDVKLTTGDNEVQYDALSIITHEVGHILGLAHSFEPDATMKIDYVPGDTSLRTLEPDDIAGICDAYPPTSTTSCDPTPRHGFASECGSPDPDDDGCSCTAPGRRSTHGALAGALLAGMCLARRRWPSGTRRR